MTQLPPQLAELVRQYQDLARAFHAGEIGHDEAVSSLTQMSAIDGRGLEWRISIEQSDPNNVVFTAAAPGQQPQATDPSAYAPPQLPPRDDLPHGGRLDPDFDMPAPTRTPSDIPAPVTNHTGRSILDEEGPSAERTGPLANIKLPGIDLAALAGRRTTVIAAVAALVVIAAVVLGRPDDGTPGDVPAPDDIAACPTSNVDIVGSDEGQRIASTVGCVQRAGALDAHLVSGVLVVDTPVTLGAHNAGMAALAAHLGTTFTSGAGDAHATLQRDRFAFDLDRVLTSAGYQMPASALTRASDSGDIYPQVADAQARLAHAGYLGVTPGAAFDFKGRATTGYWVQVVGRAAIDRPASTPEPSGPSAPAVTPPPVAAGPVPTDADVAYIISALTSGERELVGALKLNPDDDAYVALVTSAYAGVPHSELEMRATGPAAQTGEGTATLQLELFDLLTRKSLATAQVTLARTDDGWKLRNWPDFSKS